MVRSFEISCEPAFLSSSTKSKKINIKLKPLLALIVRVNPMKIIYPCHNLSQINVILSFNNKKYRNEKGGNSIRKGRWVGDLYRSTVDIIYKVFYLCQLTHETYRFLLQLKQKNGTARLDPLGDFYTSKDSRLTSL